jgi:UDP-N-acetylglucosamine 2-epimerase (non-hydrolysing)
VQCNTPERDYTHTRKIPTFSRLSSYKLAAQGGIQSEHCDSRRGLLQMQLNTLNVGQSFTRITREFAQSFQSCNVDHSGSCHLSIPQATTASTPTALRRSFQSYSGKHTTQAAVAEGFMANILMISGTRPEIIKLAPVYHALRESSWARVTWLHTAQHGDMARLILDSFDVKPDIVLQRPGTTLLDFSLACREQLDGVMTQQAWSLVVVQGDTESAFQGALAAFYNRVPLAHVEAGLRTYNLDRPFPEEGLRQMISRLARFQFAPTERSRAALQAEGVPKEHVRVTGNTVVDAQHWVCKRHGLARRATDAGHLLVTAHRRENWGADLAEICHALADIAALFPKLEILFPVHLNPVIQGPVHSILGSCANVRLVPPLNYLDMQQALADAWLLLTDSGGLQEEAPTFGVPVLVLRNETERPEAIEAGCAQIVGAGRRSIVDAVVRLTSDAAAYARMQRAGNPFGDGHASQRITATLADHFMPEKSAQRASAR